MWSDLSPQAVKAKQEAYAQDQLWKMRLTPSLARTTDKAIIQWPEYGGRQRRQAWRAWLGENLPQFAFNHKRNWFEAPLAELATAAGKLPEAKVSKGAKEYLDGTTNGNHHL